MGFLVLPGSVPTWISSGEQTSDGPGVRGEIKQGKTNTLMHKEYHVLFRYAEKSRT